MKKWSKPELIVLARSRPEEAVLNGCKSWTEPGPGATFAGCRTLNKESKCTHNECSAGPAS
jgi:hypothetical protein